VPAPESPARPPLPFKLLFVCLGNICRSPTAEGVMRALVADAGLEEAIHIDSAGTGSWHVGSAPDERATDAARARGLVLEGTARQVQPADFVDFDLLVAMDGENARELGALAEDDEQRAKVRLLREFDPQSPPDLDVPDPYYGGPGGFDEVLDLVQAACEGLLVEIREGRVPSASTGL
jgi:protein-tyrosine phosphatase